MAFRFAIDAAEPFSIVPYTSNSYLYPYVFRSNVQQKVRSESQDINRFIIIIIKVFLAVTYPDGTNIGWMAAHVWRRKNSL